MHPIGHDIKLIGVGNHAENNMASHILTGAKLATYQVRTLEA